MKIQSIGRAVAATAFVLSTSVVAPTLAHAEAASVPAREIVRFADLNLASPEGDRALLARVQDAARNVCGPTEVVGNHLLPRAWRDCVSSTVRDAVLRINDATLTAYYTERLHSRWVWTAGT
jgi:UrcA family protein